MRSAAEIAALLFSLHTDSGEAIYCAGSLEGAAAIHETAADNGLHLLVLAPDGTPACLDEMAGPPEASEADLALFAKWRREFVARARPARELLQILADIEEQGVCHA